MKKERNVNKRDKRGLMYEQKQESLEKNKKLINKYRLDYDMELTSTCDLLSDNIYIQHCSNQTLKQKWTAFVHLTTSLPYRNSVGRQVKLFIVCGKSIIGMVHLTSAMAQLKLRDEYLGWSYDEKWTNKKINGIYNVQTCVSMKYQDLLTCKLLVYCVFSKEIKSLLMNLYRDKVNGIEITSLYGKSSVYNRIPFLKYLGKTEGNSAVLISDENWKKLLNEYNIRFAKKRGKAISKTRLAPVKFQIINKMEEEYIRNNETFPYDYKKVEFERGVYFGSDFDYSLNERINQWKTRWLIPRMERLRND